jgi:hypothetical protein
VGDCGGEVSGMGKEAIIEYLGLSLKTHTHSHTVETGKANKNLSK